MQCRIRKKILSFCAAERFVINFIRYPGSKSPDNLKSFKKFLQKRLAKASRLLPGRLVKILSRSYKINKPLSPGIFRTLSTNTRAACGIQAHIRRCFLLQLTDKKTFEVQNWSCFFSDNTNESTKAVGGFRYAAEWVLWVELDWLAGFGSIRISGEKNSFWSNIDTCRNTLGISIQFRPIKKRFISWVWSQYQQHNITAPIY